MVAHTQPVVRGTVVDSTGRTTLRGATIRIVPAATPWSEGATTTSDSIGRFVVTGLDVGRYLIGFSHPRLDSLEFDAVSRVFDITKRDGEVTMDIGLPGARSISTALCGALAPALGVFFGRVYRAETGESASSGFVIVSWRELSLQGGTRQLTERRLQAKVAADGRYVICSVPTDVTLAGFVQQYAPDSSSGSAGGAIDLAFADSSTVMYRSFVMLGEHHRDDTMSVPMQAQRRPQLVGRVRDGTGHPLDGARVIVSGAVPGDSVVFTDSLGRFRLNVPHGGSYTIAISRIGFTPARHSIDLLDRDTVRVEYALTRQAFELDRVVVSERATMEQAGFDRRRLSRRGFFLDGAQISATGALFASRLLLAAPMLMQWGSNAAGRPIVTGPLQCTPLLFVDGAQTPMAVYTKPTGNTPFTRDQSRIAAPEAAIVPDVDNVLPTSEMRGLEVYAPGEAPARFADPFGRCSSIVIWSRATLR
jgi:Carboxypeptidase regulatory-like domain